jgi:hypothetical protein
MYLEKRVLIVNLIRWEPIYNRNDVVFVRHHLKIPSGATQLHIAYDVHLWSFLQAEGRRGAVYQEPHNR